MKVDLTMYCKPVEDRRNAVCDRPTVTVTIADCLNEWGKFLLDKTDAWSQSGLVGKVCPYHESYLCGKRDFTGRNNKSNGFVLLKDVMLDGDYRESMDRAVILYMREWRKRIALALEETEQNLKYAEIWFHYHDTVKWNFSLTTNAEKLYRRKRK